MPTNPEPQVASKVEVRLDEPAAAVPPAGSVAEAGPASAAAPAEAAPAARARRLGVDVKPDHPPMPLVRSGGSANAVPQTAVVPLQTATVVPRPPTFASPTSPADVPRQMMEALDKYSRMQNARGARVDLAN
jgi:hypothetical protein